MESTRQKLKFEHSCLFIGGSLHGQFYPVAHNMESIRKYLDKDNMEFDYYKATWLRMRKKKIRVFVIEDFDSDPIHFLMAMIEAYEGAIKAPPMERDQRILESHYKSNPKPRGPNDTGWATIDIPTEGT